MRSASSTRWLLSYEDLFVGAQALLVSNLDCDLGSDVFQIPLGPKDSHNPEEVQLIHRFQDPAPRAGDYLQNWFA